MTESDELISKRKKLFACLKEYKQVMIAFSGGVDSTFLLAAAKAVLGRKNVIAVTAASPLHPPRETQRAQSLAADMGIRHQIIESTEWTRPDFAANTQDRCYFCKKHLLRSISTLAGKMAVQVILHGANVDDLRDYRPGMRAAQEMGVAAPLMEAGLGKEEIRRLSQQMALPTWNLPAMACLATRIPYGTPITRKILDQVAQAEEILASAGFTVFRVRHHDEIARIELPPAEFPKLLDPRVRGDICKRMARLGYIYITLDLEGYVSGSMNRALGIQP